MWQIDAVTTEMTAGSVSAADVEEEKDGEEDEDAAAAEDESVK